MIGEEVRDEDLAVRAADGDERAFRELHNRYRDRLMSFAYGKVGDRERAEEIIQETFVRVYRHLHGFDRSKKFSTWVFTITSNLLKNELRDRGRGVETIPVSQVEAYAEDPEDADLLERTEDPGSRADARARRAELLAALRQAWRGLSREKKGVLRRRFVLGMPYSDIAADLGLFEGTVKSRLARAKRDLAAGIGPVLEELGVTSAPPWINQT